MEQAFPGRKGVLKEGWLLGMPVTYEEIEGKAVFQGDIVLGPSQLSHTPPSLNKAAQSTGRLTASWANNLVFYTIQSSLPNQARVTSAIADWESKTRLRFIRWENHPGQPNYVTFRHDADPNACYSTALGNAYAGQQFIGLGNNCSTGNVIHEIGHAVGFFHEHCRADRDNTIIIHWNNIWPGYAPQFYSWNDPRHQQAFGVPTWDGFDLGVLDFGSIMMYPMTAFSVNGNPTITRHNGQSWTAQRTALSTGDVTGVNYKYPLIWEFVGDFGRTVGAGADGSVWVTGTPAQGSDFSVYRYHGYWIQENIKGVRLDVDRNGYPWVVNNNGNIYHWDGNNWNIRDFGLKFNDVTAGADGSVWAISKTAVSGGFRIYQWNGNGWTLKPGGATRISVGADGRPWVVNSSFAIYRWNGTGWTQMPGTARDVGVGSDNTVWILENSSISNGFLISVWNGSAWRRVPNSAGISIDIDASGNPWAITTPGGIYN